MQRRKTNPPRNTMSFLRFTPEEYRVIRRLCEQIPLGGTDITALRHFLIAYMPLDQLTLAKRIARLDRRQMRLLREDLLGQGQTKVSAAPSVPFTEEELQAITRTIDLPRSHPRLLRLFQRSVVERLSDAYPSLARKLARLTERQFHLLYQHVKGRREGTA